jgi:hypothetical protein
VQQLLMPLLLLLLELSCSSKQQLLGTHATQLE